MRRALLLGCRPPAAPRSSLIRHVLAGARPPRPRGTHLVRAGLGMQEDTELCGRAHARTPGAEVHLHLCRGVCVVRVIIGPIAGSESFVSQKLRHL